MDQLEAGGPATAGATGIFGWPRERRGLDDFEQVGDDGLNKAANGMLLGFAPRLGAAVDDPGGQSPTYDAGLASRDAGPAPIARGLGAVYGVGASPDPNGLAQTLHALARSEAMGGVLGMGLPHAAPLAAGLAASVGRFAANATNAFSNFDTTLFDHSAPADDGAPGGAYADRRYDSETGIYHDRARAYSPSLDHLLRADPIGAQRGNNLDAYGGTDPAGLIDPWGSAVPQAPSARPENGLDQSPAKRNNGLTQQAQLLPFLETPPIEIIPRVPTTPLEGLPEGSSGGRTAGKRFPRQLNERNKQQNPNCYLCDRPTTDQPGPDQYNGDHIIPRAQGGNGSPENIGTTCRTCNLQKGNRTPQQYVPRFYFDPIRGIIIYDDGGA